MVKDNYKTQSIETTEDSSKVKTKSRRVRTTILFQGQSARLQHLFDLDPFWIEENFMTREPGFSKDCTLNIFEVKRIRICLHFMSQFDVKILQGMFNLSQMPLSSSTRNMIKYNFFQ